MEGLISPVWNIPSKYGGGFGQKSFKWNIITPIAYILLGFILGTYYSSVYPPPSFQADIGTIFNIHEIYTEAPSPESDEAWNSLIPLGRGFIGVDENEQPLLYEGIDILDLSRVRSISLFHQIHCLNELRLGYYSAPNPNHTMHDEIKETEKIRETDKIETGKESEGDRIANHLENSRRPVHDHGENHMRHCFDYLRQAITCAADMSMEKLRESDDGRIFPGVDGWGSEHQCRDLGEVEDWAVRYRASGGEGIQ